MNNIQFIFSTLHNSIKHTFHHSLFVSVFTSEPGTIPYLIAFLLNTFSLGISWWAKSSQNISCNMLLLAIQHIHLLELPPFCIYFPTHVHIHQHICIKYSKNKHTGMLFPPKNFVKLPIGHLSQLIKFPFSLNEITGSMWDAWGRLQEMCPIQ